MVERVKRMRRGAAHPLDELVAAEPDRLEM
jgi:hypothetical protein